MWQKLHLKGFTKEVFAVIFNFWNRARTSAVIPYVRIHEITGASRSVISKAVNDLVKLGYISTIRESGRANGYVVTIPPVLYQDISPYGIQTTTGPKAGPPDKHKFTSKRRAVPSDVLKVDNPFPEERASASLITPAGPKPGRANT